MRLSHESVTECLGPGLRYVIWTQGCAKRCKGCINPEGAEIGGGYEKTVSELSRSVLTAKNICGITISGGEPFLQYDELFSLLKELRQSSDLGVMIYTGYTYEELLDIHKNDDISEFFSMVDILVDGEYREELNTNSAFRGSDNQRIIFLSSEYESLKNEMLGSKNRKISFDILDSGDVFLIGIPPKGFYRKFLEELGGV